MCLELSEALVMVAGSRYNWDMTMPLRRRFVPRLDVLAKAQLTLWPELSETPDSFVLYGGTAIALRLGHRESADFDFFTRLSFSPQELLSSVPYLRDAEAYQIEPHSLGCRVYRRNAPVQLSFFKPVDFPRLESAELTEDIGLKVASLRDLAVTKLTVVQQRAEKKDYLDLHAMLHQAGMSLEDMLADAHEAYGDRFAPLPSLQALGYFEDGDVRFLPDQLKRDLERDVASVDLDRLARRLRKRDREPEIKS